MLEKIYCKTFHENIQENKPVIDKSLQKDKSFQ